MSRNVSPRQDKIVEILRARTDAKGMTQHAIQEALGIPDTSILHALTGLYDRKLILRRKSPGGPKAPMLYFYNRAHAL